MVINIFPNTPQYFIDDVMVAREYLHNIKDQINTVRNHCNRLDELTNEIAERDKNLQVLKDKSTAITSTINMWIYNLNDLCDKLDNASFFDFSTKRGLKKKIVEAKEYLNDLYDSQMHANTDFAKNTHHKLEKIEENQLLDTKKELYLSVKELASDISEYRQFRALFKQEYDEMLPEVNLNDYISVSDGVVSVSDATMPYISTIYYENIYIRTEENVDGANYSAEEI